MSIDKMKIEPVNITTKAIQEVKNILTTKGIPENYSLRIGIKGGGCGAMGFLLGFDEKNDADIIYQSNDVEVIIDKKHVMYLMGVEVDFHEDGESRGFVFNKPE